MSKPKESFQKLASKSLPWFCFAVVFASATTVLESQAVDGPARQEAAANSLKIESLEKYQKSRGGQSNLSAVEKIYSAMQRKRKPSSIPAMN